MSILSSSGSGGVWVPWKFRQGGILAGTVVDDTFTIDLPNNGQSIVQGVATALDIGITAAASTATQSYFEAADGTLIWANEQEFSLGLGYASWRGWIPFFGNTTWRIYTQQSTLGTIGYILSGYVYFPG